MPTQKLPSQQRISKSTGRMMIGIAAIFDLIPILLLLIVAFLVIADISPDYSDENTNIALANKAAAVENPQDGWTGIAVGAIKMIANVRKAGKTVIAAGEFLLFGAAGLVLGPIIYTIGSFIATALAYIVFIIWFYMKGVNVLTFSSGERVLVNLMSVVIEYIPIVNLFPSITIGVWRHIKVSQVEDKIKDNELLSKASKAINRLAYA